MSSVRVLLTGAGGQLGQALLASQPPGTELHALTRAELDIGDAQAVQREIRAFAPQLVLNASAYTAVDRAEQEPELAARANAAGPGHLAAALADASGRLVHVSTDYVFGGNGSTPYEPGSATAPIGVYGSTKLAGEHAVREALAGRVAILRTAWVYSATGRNFLQTMLRLMRERGAVSVVADQFGTPTSTRTLAAVVWALGNRPDLHGVLHWTDAGVASWYDFAVAIAEEAFAAGRLDSMPTVLPIATRDYPTAARRPAFSVLDSSATRAALGLQAVHWRERLRAIIQEIPIA